MTVLGLVTAEGGAVPTDGAAVPRRNGGKRWRARKDSMSQTDAEIVVAVDVELRRGDPRSSVYREAMIDVLRFRLRGVEIPLRYRPGTVEADAAFSGNDRGHVLWRKLMA